MADFFLEPNPDWGREDDNQWKTDWLLGILGQTDADNTVRKVLRARYADGQRWNDDIDYLSSVCAANPKGKASRLIQRWIRNFFSAGAPASSSATDEFSAMLSAWLAKKTAPIRPRLEPDYSRDFPPERITWEDSIFCFTGSLNWATREIAEGIVVSRGGRCVASSEILDYLVHGPGAGSKLTRARANRAKGRPVVFIEGETLPDYF